jgi:hypothetical protein
MAVRSIGNMRESVVFLQNTPQPAPAGGYTDNYTTLLTTRGQLIDISGSRSLSFGEVTNNSSMKLICRFQSALESALRSDVKIVISAITYTFSSYKLIDQKKHLYEFDIQCQTQ